MRGLLGRLDALHRSLDQASPSAVAVSGGVDSMTLAFTAHRRLGERVSMFHAVSPAVPAAATDRVRAYAAKEGWALMVIDAGEFADERYMANPANRCFFAKATFTGPWLRKPKASCSRAPISTISVIGDPV